MVRLALLLAGMIALFGCGAANAGAPGSTAFTHSRWTGRDGVPGMVQALAQTPDGYLWIGTYEGLYRFDGVSFEYVAPAPGHPAGSIPVSGLLVTRSGDLWVGYAGGAGVEVRRGGRMLRGGMPNPPGEITEMREDRDGAIWAVGGRGRRTLKRLHGGRWQTIDSRFGVPNDEAVSSLLVAGDGTIWLATERTLLFLRRGNARFEQTGRRLPNGASMAQDSAGNLWLSDPEGTRMLPDYARGERVARNRAFYPAKAPVRRTSILFDRAGNLWGTTYTGGAFRIAAPGSPDAAVERYRTDDGLSSNQAVALLDDREGNIWIATELGLDQFRNANVAAVPLPPRTSAFGYTMATDARGDVYIASGDVLFRARPNGEPEPVLTGIEGQALCRGEGGVLWYAVPGRVLRLREGRVEAALPLPDRTPATGCSVTDGRLWIARQSAGLLMRQGDGWRQLGFAADSRSPRDIVTPWRGMLVATLARRSVVLVDGTRQHTLSNAQIGVSGLTTIHGTPGGLLIGGGLGLARYDGRSFQRLSIADHPWLRGLRGILQTPRGETWMLNNKGILRIATADLERAFASPHAPIPHTLFDEQDGFASRTQNSDGLQLVAGADGRLWFLTRQGVVRVDPARLSRNTTPPPVHIAALTADGRRYADPTALTLPAGTRNLSIDYAGLSLSVPSRVRFRYMLEGVDAAWIDPGTRRQAFYTNLAPGKYRFLVIAANNDGVWNRAGATLAFEIRPTFVQSPLFALLCLAAIALVLWGVYALRLRALARRMRARMAERLGERERIARELHDTLLQGVQALILRFQLAADDVPPEMPARRSLEEALDRADIVLAEGRDRVRDLRIVQAGDDIERLILDIVRRQAFPPTTHVRVVTEGEPRPLVPFVCDEMARIANEALFNIWRHAQASQVEVEIAFRSFAFSVHFRDNGVGIDREVLQAGRREGHFGLTGMRERAERLQADLTIAAAPAGGTVVALIVPGSIAYARSARRGRGRKLVTGGEIG